jgi:hypothetical protein
LACTEEIREIDTNISCKTLNGRENLGELEADGIIILN